MSSADPDPMLRRRLRRYRALASGLLLLMAAIAVMATVLPHRPWADALRAASRAGFIGGIADWFAVTALFRRPLGLPIPHTAVIPRQKVRLGRALGDFVANHVLTPAEIHRLLGRADVAGALGRALAEDAVRRRTATTVAGLLPALLAGISEGRARRMASVLVPQLFAGPDLERLFARALRGLVQGQRHQAVVSFVVDRLRDVLRAKETQLRALIADRVREQGGRVIGWALGGSIAGRVMAVMSQELDNVDPEGSEIREAITGWIEDQVALFEREPARAAEFERAVRGVVGHEAVASWGADVWTRLRDAVGRDATDPDGYVVRLVGETLDRLGRLLREDEAVRARVDEAVAAVFARFLPSGRARMADFIASVVAGWDERMLVDRLELRVGRDLQYIRINGTVVGFLAGAAVYVLLGNA